MEGCRIIAVVIIRERTVRSVLNGPFVLLLSLTLRTELGENGKFLISEGRKGRVLPLFFPILP